MDRRLMQNAWLWLMASTAGMVGCQHGGSNPFPDVPLFQAKKPLIGSRPRPAGDLMVLAEPDMPSCSPAALAQLPGCPEPVAVETQPFQTAAMPHPPWLDPAPPQPRVASEQTVGSQAGMLVSRNKNIMRTSEQLRGILTRDQAGRYYLICYSWDAAKLSWDRVRLLDCGQLSELEAGTTIQVTGTWEEQSSSAGQSVFRVARIQTLPPAVKR